MNTVTTTQNKTPSLQQAMQHLHTSEGAQKALECVSKLFDEHLQAAKKCIVASGVEEPVLQTLHVAQLTHPLKDLKYRLTSYLKAAPSDLPLLAVGIKNSTRAIPKRMASAAKDILNIQPRTVPQKVGSAGSAAEAPSQTVRELSAAVNNENVETACSLIVKHEIDVCPGPLMPPFLYSPALRSLEMYRLLIRAGAHDDCCQSEALLVVREMIPKALENRAWRPVLQTFCTPNFIVLYNCQLFQLALQSTEHMDLLFDCGFYPVKPIDFSEEHRRLLPALVFNGVECNSIPRRTQNETEKLAVASEITRSFFTQRAQAQVKIIFSSIASLQSKSYLSQLIGEYAQDRFEDVSFVARQDNPLAITLFREMRAFCYKELTNKGLAFSKDQWNSTYLGNTIFSLISHLLKV